MNKQRAFAKPFSILFFAVTFFIAYYFVSGASDKNLTPIFGQSTLEFDGEVIVIKSEASTNANLSLITDMKIDSRGYFYLLDPKHKGVLIFDGKGSYVKTIGSLGRGPGDFLMPWKLFIDSRDHIYISDIGNFNVTELTPEWKVQQIVRINKMMGSNFFVSSQGDIFGFIRDMDQTGITRRLVKYDQKGEQSAFLFDFKDSGFLLIRGKEGGALGGVFHQYTPTPYLSPLDNDSFYYGYNLEDKIYFYNVKTAAVKMALLPGPKEPITGDEESYFNKQYGKMAQLPVHRPFFNKLLCDEKGRIYVLRVKSILSGDKKVLMDVFNKAGEYIYRFESPIDPLLIRDGNMYVAAEDASLNVILKKFHIKNYAVLKF